MTLHPEMRDPVGLVIAILDQHHVGATRRADLDPTTVTALTDWASSILADPKGIDLLMAAWANVAAWLVANITALTKETPAAVVERVRHELLDDPADPPPDTSPFDRPDLPPAPGPTTCE